MQDASNVTLRQLIGYFLEAEKKYPEQSTGELRLIIGDEDDSKDIEIVIRRPKGDRT